MTKEAEHEILGWHGLTMAKTYLEAHAEMGEQPKLVLMDAGSSVGGTWAEDRLYPGLKTNNIVGSYEFSDYPLIPEKYGLRPGQHIPGHVVHMYLSDFAEHYSIGPRVRFRTKVKAANLQENETWLVDYSTEHFAGAQGGRIVARKIAVATGLTSEPSIPVFPGQETFKGNIFHSRALRDQANNLATSQNVVVVGGNKSAWDVCYTAARSGAQVHMLIRPSGGGPSWVWRPHRMGRFSISRLSSTRFFSWFDPSPFGKPYRGPRDFMRHVWLGRLLCWLFWRLLDYCARASTGYYEDFLAPLRPWSSTFWMGNSLSIHNYETDWFELVRSGRVRVHHAEIAALGAAEVYLSDNETLKADTVVTCTGWKNTCMIEFGPAKVAAELGLPSRTDFGQRAVLEDATLMAKAQQEVLQQFPELSRMPVQDRSPSQLVDTGRKQDQTNGHSGTIRFRLYHFIVPPSGETFKLRNLAFIGMHQSIHTVMVAQAQALWATAFFQGRVPVLSAGNIDRLRYETYLESEYARCRRPKEGAGSDGKYLDLVFDTVPYVDLLLDDLGVRTKRKTSWVRDIFEPYSIREYVGIVEEWTNFGPAHSTKPS